MMRVRRAREASTGAACRAAMLVLALASTTMLAAFAAQAADAPNAAAPAIAPAAPAAAAAAGPGAGGLAQAVVGLALVLALIWGAAWLMRRLQPQARMGGSALKIVAAQAVGQRERVVVVEVADHWLVVGVAQGSVNALATLPKGTLPEASATAHPFAGFLARARGQVTK